MSGTPRDLDDCDADPVAACANTAGAFTCACPSDYFGAAVTLSSDGSTLVVGAPLESSEGVGVNGAQTDTATGTARTSRGAVYAFTRAGTTWSQQAYFKSSRSGAGSFGSSLALAADGNTLAASDPTNSDVHVFTRAGAVWAAQRVVRPSRPDFGDFFGAAVSLAADGNTLAVGAPFEDSNAVGIGGNELNNSAGNSGAAFVFTRTGGTWTQRVFIKASNTETRDLFGTSVALSRDGLTLAVGAPEEDSDATGVGGDQTNNRAAESGATYVFTYDGVAWSQQAYEKASNAALGDGFGASVSLASDGATLAIGAPKEDSNARGVRGDETNNAELSAGAAYVLVRVAGVWSQLAYVKASNPDAGDLFGGVLSLCADGASLIVGAVQEYSNSTGIGSTPNELAPDSGAAYLF